MRKLFKERKLIQGEETIQWRKLYEEIRYVLFSSYLCTTFFRFSLTYLSTEKSDILYGRSQMAKKIKLEIEKYSQIKMMIRIRKIVEKWLHVEEF